MNIEINPDFEKSTTLRALSAFLTLLADEAEGETKDGLILSAIVQKGLNHVDENPPMTATEVLERQATAILQAQEQADQALLKAQEEAAAPLKEAVKRTRRTKAEMAADLGNVDAAPAANTPRAPSPAGVATAVAPTTTDLTIDDVRAALQRYTAVHGMPDGIALLKNYGAGRISELGIEQYPLFIAECDAVEAA